MLRAPCRLSASFALTAALSLTGAASAQPSTEVAQDFYHSFKGKTELSRPFELWGVDSAAMVRQEMEGLRITLPTGQAGVRPPAGISLPIVVQGDFAITASYEILQAPEPAVLLRKVGPGLDKQTRFTVDIVLDKPGLNAASFSRTVHGRGVQFACWSGLQAEPTDKPQIRMAYSAAPTRAGRLRLSRSGITLSYLAAQDDAGNFTLIRQFPFTVDDLKEVRLVGSTGAADSSLDVRVLDLHIHAKAMPGIAVPAATTTTETHGFLVILALGSALALAAGICWHIRPRRRSPRWDGASVAFSCPQCGKSLKAAGEKAGKKVKCPGCNSALSVPAPDEGLASRERGQSRLPWLLVVAVLIGFLLVGGWRFLQKPADRPSFLNVALGNDLVAGVEESGFFEQEHFEGQSFRWTNGRGKLVIPIDKNRPPQALLVELRIFRPPEVRDIPLQIVANQRDLFNNRVAGSRWERIFDLSNIDLGDRLVLEIVSDTFAPRGVMEGGANQDPRTALGVQVWQVNLLRTEAAH